MSNLQKVSEIITAEHRRRALKLAEWQRKGLVMLEQKLDTISGCDYYTVAHVDECQIVDPNERWERYPSVEGFARIALAVQALK